jgi:hypothetical protein
MSYYKRTSPTPIIAAVVLLGAFIGIIVWATGEKEQEIPRPPVARRAPAPLPVPPVPQEEPPLEVPLDPPPKPQLSGAQAEKRLRTATREWRAFTVRLCQTKKWPSARAVAFLEKVTWSDRDLEKQHANGLESIRRMLGVETKEPVALAEALAEKGGLRTFFEQNWSRVDVEWEAAPERDVTVLEDAWKPNRIRWGFPLDTPVEKLQEFKLGSLRVALQAWPALAGGYVQSLEIDDDAKHTKWRAATGEGIRAQEAKLHAAFRVLFDMPKASVKEVVEEFVRQAQKEGGAQQLAQTLAGKLDGAVTAAEKAG